MEGRETGDWNRIFEVKGVYKIPAWVEEAPVSRKESN